MARADAEGNGTERTVCRGVAITAGNRHTRLGQAQLGTDHVDDALVHVVQIEEADAEILTVGFEGNHHLLRQAIGEGSLTLLRRYDVVGCGEGSRRVSDGPSPPSKVGKRLRDSQDMAFDYNDDVVRQIADRCTDIESGARNIDHIINKTLLPIIATEILTNIGEETNYSRLKLETGEQGEFVTLFEQ